MSDRSIEWFHALFDAAPVAASLTDDRDTLLTANPALAHLAARPLETLTGQPLDALFPADADPPAPTATRWQVAAVGPPLILVLFDSLHPLPPSELDATALEAMTTDTTHEVKNLLAGMGGALQVIRDRLPDRPTEQAICSEILERLARINSTVDGLYRFATPADPRPTPVSLALALREALEFLAREPRFATAKVELPEHDVELLADTSDLRTVLVNLLAEALGVTGEQGRVRVRATYGAGSGLCDVDIAVVPGDGGGAAPLARSPNRSQSGLGLAVARKLAVASGGEVRQEWSELGREKIVLRVPLAPSGGTH